MGFVKEFRDFAIKGNVFDMAIGVIMGGAFGKIVGSLIENILNPVIGKVAGKVNFNDMFIPLSSDPAMSAAKTYDEAKKIGPALGHGAFATEVINFLILAFVVFLMVKAFNTAKARFEEKKVAPPPAPAGPTTDQKLLMEIRDLLAKR